jgi:hypothetical protein
VTKQLLASQGGLSSTETVIYDDDDEYDLLFPVDCNEIKAFPAATTFDNLDSDCSHIGRTAISFTWCQARSAETGINCELRAFLMVEPSVSCIPK